MYLMFSLLLFMGMVTIYLIPSIIAMKREHSNLPAIVTLNLLFGWTFLGWGIALIWSFTDNKQDKRRQSQIKGN